MKGLRKVTCFILMFSMILGLSISNEARVKAADASAKDNGKTVLLMHMDGENGSTSFKDETGKNVIYTGNAKISTDQNKFGGASAYFDSSSSSILRIQKSSELDFGADDFTIDFWYYPTNETRNALLYMGATNFAIDYNYQGTRNINIWAGNDEKSWNLISSDPGGNGIGHKSLNLNQWNHIAVAREGNVWRTFINGVKDTEITVAGEINCTPNTDYGTVIGGMGELGENYKAQGYFDELRIVKGAALYTKNFNPPTTPYPYSTTIPTETITGNKAILEVVMTNNTIKEYDLTADELNNFITWYDNRSDGIGKSYYRMIKRSNVKPFNSRYEYLQFDKIYSFEVKDYNE
ncbi:LamG domain-containing protein [Anaeromicropila herbilytica]|uniref:LamG-like jellyroll fold domain-containing protein n=1 Tax=Anaeromicropila herbilytica TaxID=2785025 RepID=A0A7R7IDU8_9FIRM|nr:LamG domain-containing protein [Anaeromicropila herbilytica]BCN32088.1 hypothetical protein bsdtb5_33830 [Anaeromicropila herbilytica]